MKKGLSIVLLVLILLFTFAARMFFALQTDKFSYDSYSDLRQIESISETGIPIFIDDLSYGGRTHLFPPLFYYLVSVFDFIGLELAAKVVTNLLFSLVVVGVFLISKLITKNRLIALITAFFSGFIPVIFSTAFEVSTYSLALPLSLFVLYFFMHIQSKYHLNMLLIFTLILVLSHSSIFFLLLGFLAYLLILRIENIESDNKENEYILFTLLLALWLYFIIYKKAFFIHESLVIWQNIPLQILTNYFYTFSIIESLYYIGVIPILFGVYAFYNVFFKAKKKSVLLIIASASVMVICLWMKLVPFQFGLMYLGIFILILAGYALKIMYYYLKKTKVPSFANWFLAGVFILFLVTSLMPSLSLASKALEKIPSDAEINAMLWLKNNTAEDATIMARVEEGFLITYFAQRKNVLDNDFLMVKDAQQRYDDSVSIYSFRLKTEVVKRLNRYDVDYIYFSGKFGDQKKFYYLDEDCFEQVYNETVMIYKVRCKI